MLPSRHEGLDLPRKHERTKTTANVFVFSCLRGSWDRRGVSGGSGGPTRSVPTRPCGGAMGRADAENADGRSEDRPADRAVHRVEFPEHRFGYVRSAVAPPA